MLAFLYGFLLKLGNVLFNVLLGFRVRKQVLYSFRVRHVLRVFLLSRHKVTYGRYESRTVSAAIRKRR